MDTSLYSNTVNKDTVEEFWDEYILDYCFENVSKTGIEELENKLCHFLNPSGKILITNSGSNALELFLRSVSSDKKPVVLICNFNCKLVAESIIKTGLKVETFDIDKHLGKIDWEEVSNKISDRTLALIVPHYFGVPNDFRHITRQCEKLGVFIIEDCCHTLGGKIDNLIAGSLGDAAIISFNYDKPISLGGGGALLINNSSLVKKIHLKKSANKSMLGIKRELDEMKEFISYLQQHRNNINKKGFYQKIYNRINPLKIPQLSEVGYLRATLGLWQLSKYDKIISIRNENAKIFFESDCLKSWHVGENISPVWLKQKIIPLNYNKAKLISNKISRLGIRVGNYNWSVTINRLLGFKTILPNSDFVAKYGIEIPIHQNMKKVELELINKIICENQT